ncbi:hypothetical protein TUM20984_49840 [Mycobacterium antarcticum]|nr:hypothetical protein TUM20984_49840 [Mycolicibacterium sp. TUM20984]
MTTSAQLRPVGADATIAHLFIGALLFSTPTEVQAVLRHVELDDFDEPARSVLGSIKTVAGQGAPSSSELVKDDLRRRGKLTRERAVWLASATTSGACASAARHYAAAAVAESLRRLTESFGAALCEVAESGAETNVAHLADAAAARIRGVSVRLGELRGGEL